MSYYVKRAAPYWDISRISNIGPKREAILREHGINTIYDLCLYFPKEYISNQTFPISIENCDSLKNYKLTVLTSPSVFRSKNGRKVLKFIASDESGTKATIMYFNQPYLKNQIKKNDTMDFYGDMKFRNGSFLMASPEINFKVDKYSKYTPVYSPIGDISAKTIRRLIHSVLFGCAAEVEENLDMLFIQRYGVPVINKAIVLIHYPCCEEDIILTRKRFAIEKLVEFAEHLARFELSRKSNILNGLKAYSLAPFEKTLPFKLTESQKKVIAEVSEQIVATHKIPAINRLIQGDVGSGKTVVAATIAYLIYKNNKSTVIMAPTEILAIQHYKTFSKFFSAFNIKIMLLTASTPKKETEEILHFAENTDEPYILIGTHSIISPFRTYSNVYLTITDEQQRFGTIQRSQLNEKCNNCHSIVMTATPIPRSLAIFLYTDDSISIIDKMPDGRKGVKTVYVGEDKKERIYKFIDEKVKSGQRVYIVCPMIEPNDELEGLISAKEQFLECKKVFKDINIGYINGKMSNNDKNEAMLKFKNGETPILVSTTVIEVGVDVPEAGVIVIMNAERLGLSQLHQLRGRVGRGTEKGHCILVSSSSSKKARLRLNFMCKHSDGFKIAEYDLKTRGPGEFFGTQQSGFFALPFSEILDEKTIKNVIEDARKLYIARIELYGVEKSTVFNNPNYDQYHGYDI